MFLNVWIEELILLMAMRNVLRFCTVPLKIFAVIIYTTDKTHSCQIWTLSWLAMEGAHLLLVLCSKGRFLANTDDNHESYINDERRGMTSSPRSVGKAHEVYFSLFDLALFIFICNIRSLNS